MSITIVRALDLASRTLLQSEPPDAIEARIVLLELCEVMERYERPSVVHLIKLKAEPGQDVRVVRQEDGLHDESTESFRSSQPPSTCI